MTEEPKQLITINQAVVQFPHIYTPTVMDNGKARYGIAFSCDETATQILINRGCNYNHEKKIFNSGSNFAPIVTSSNGEYGLLKEAYSIAALRNKSRDSLFRDLEVELKLWLYPYSRQGYDGVKIEGIGISVEEIIVNPGTLLQKVMS